VPKCKTCSNYWHKDFSINYECRLGYDTPDFGDTDACSSYDEQYTFGQQSGGSYEKERSQNKTDDHAEHEEEDQTSSSGYSGYSSSSGSSFSEWAFGNLLGGGIAVAIAFGAIWVTEHVTRFSGAWWIAVVIGVPAVLYAIRFMLAIAILLGIAYVLIQIVVHFVGTPSTKPDSKPAIYRNTATSSMYSSSRDNNLRPATSGSKAPQSNANEFSVSASGYLNPSGGLNYYPQNATDENLSTWWTPSPNRDGQNTWIRLDFKSIKTISAIDILVGSHYANYPKYGNLWDKNNRLTKAVLRFSNGNQITVSMRDVDEVQRIQFQPQETSYIILYPVEWIKGTKWNDLCISHLKPIEVIVSSKK